MVSSYPFGLQMAGISDAALGKLNSQNKFNSGSELEEDYGVNLYSTFYRRYDPQIGRFSGVDSKSESTIGMSVYQFGGNNPVSMNDPLGDQFKYMDSHGTKWHHADVLEGTALESQHYIEGYGTDGFGGEGGGGGGGGGGGNSSGNYSAFWNMTVYQVNHGQELTGFKKVERQVYNYSQVNGPYAFETRNNDGLTIDQEDGKYYFTGISTNISYEVRGNSSGFHSSNDEGNGWLEPTIHLNDGIGGLGSGLDYSSGTFRITNGTYNSSELSFKYYSSGWKGGSRAGISTYEVAGFGKGLAKGSLVAGVVLGGIGVYEGYQKDGGMYGTNAQLATGNAAGGLIGGWAGAETGAAFGASIGVWFFGAGAVPGAIIGGVLGGVIGGFAGGEAGEDVVRDIRN